MHIARLKISGFRGVRSADIALGRHAVLVGPNNTGKTTIIEALALLFGRDRLVRRLTEHDFHGSTPDVAARITIIATVTGFPRNDPQHNVAWFALDRGVEKWLDPKGRTLKAAPTALHTDLAVQIGFGARFDLDELEAETIRFFVDDEETLGDPFAEDAHLRTVHTKTLQELGFFLVPASRTWDRWISFSSELFRRVVATRGGMPAQAVRAERQRLWNPPEAERLENQRGLTEIVNSANEELRHLLPTAPQLKLRLTGTDSDSVLETVIPHFAQGAGPTLPAMRQGMGLVSLQSLLLLMQFGKARAETGKSFVLAVEEPELHIQPAQQKRLVNRLNALCDQTIVTTHSPIVAAMFPVPDTLFIETSNGTLTAKPLMDTIPVAPTNHQQHLLYAWRQKLVASLMHECVLIPEGVSDVAWLEALQTALELQQGWEDAQDNRSRFSTFVGVVPTIDAKVADTFSIVNKVHARPGILVDGDADGRGYFDAVRASPQPPKCFVFWPQGWAMEHVVAWIAGADEVNVLAALGTALGQHFATTGELVAFLLARKSYAPTHRVRRRYRHGEYGLPYARRAIARRAMRCSPRSRERQHRFVSAHPGGLDPRDACLQILAMTLDFFEGAAGTGKTHNLIGRAGECVQDGVLGEDRRILALTFMNGARRRLQARLAQNVLFRSRFECQTFDVFARTLAARRRSLLSENAAALAQAGTLNEFDGPCFLAAALLETLAVQRWVAASFPLVLVDEAQDLDDHRMRILQGLSASCSIVAAADAFQCLTDGRDTGGVIRWLEGAGRTHRLVLPRRTAQRGLLAAASAVKEERDIKAVLMQSQQARNPTWNGQGFRLLQTHANNTGLVAWAIANEMSQWNGQTAILTPDAGNTLLRTALETVRTRTWNRNNGRTFGPFPFTWETQDAEAAATLLADVQLPRAATYADFCTALEPIASHAPVAHTIARMDRLRRVCGQNDFTAARVGELVREAVRNEFAPRVSAAPGAPSHDDPARQEPRVPKCHRSLAPHGHGQPRTSAQVALQRHHARDQPLQRHRPRARTPKRPTFRTARHCLMFSQVGITGTGIAEFRRPRSVPLRFFPSSAKSAPVAAAPPHRRRVVRLAQGRGAASGNWRRVLFTHCYRERDKFFPNCQTRLTMNFSWPRRPPLEATAVTRQEIFAEARLSMRGAVSL